MTMIGCKRSSLTSVIVFVVIVMAALFSTGSVDVDAFTSVPKTTSAISTQQQQQQSTPFSVSVGRLPQPHLNGATVSSTALQLKIKVDPEAAKKGGGKINPGAAKGAAYGGSIVIAVLLPVAFLIWAAVGK